MTMTYAYRDTRFSTPHEADIAAVLAYIKEKDYGGGPADQLVDDMEGDGWTLPYATTYGDRLWAAADALDIQD
jgi:hypothetical protein